MRLIENFLGIKINRTLDSQRIGSIFDGGYILTFKTIGESDFLISGGLHYNLDFEYEFYKLNSNSKFVLIDGSLGIIKFFVGIIIRPWFLLFFRRFNLNGFIDVLKTIEVLIKKGYIKKFINNNYNITKIISSNKLVNKVGVLKLDIENSEYLILDDIIRNKESFSAILIEFHQTHTVENQIKIKNFYLNLGFECIDIAVNELGGFVNETPVVIEASFVNRNYITNDIPYQNRANHPSKELVIIE